MHERDTILRQQLPRLAEERGVVIDAHMLEHADRDDTIVLTFDVAVVLQMEVHSVLEARTLRAFLRELQLSYGQRHAVHGAAGCARQIEAEATPTGTDIQYPVPVADSKLGGEMPLLGDLRLLQVHTPVGEIRAGVLPVAVEEQIVDRAVDIVVVGNVVARAARRIELR